MSEKTKSPELSVKVHLLQTVAPGSQVSENSPSSTVTHLLHFPVAMALGLLTWSSMVTYENKDHPGTKAYKQVRRTVQKFNVPEN